MVFFYFSEEKFPSFEDSSMLRRHLHFSNRTRKQSLPKKRDGKARQGEGEIKAGRDKRRASSKCTPQRTAIDSAKKWTVFSPRTFNHFFFTLFRLCSPVQSPPGGRRSNNARLAQGGEKRKESKSAPPPPFSLRTIMEQHAFGGGEGEKGT